MNAIDSRSVSSSKFSCFGFVCARPVESGVDALLTVRAFDDSSEVALLARTTSWLSSFSWNLVRFPNLPVSAKSKDLSLAAAVRSLLAFTSKP